MKRSQILAAAGAIIALILLVLTLRQVPALRDEVDGLRDRLFQMEQSLTDEINGIDNDICRELERESSLFSSAEASLDYRDGALVLTASVLPKEVGADEILTLSAGGVSVPMTAGADGTYTGTLTLTLPLVQELSPAVSFTSPAGTRQETLDSLWTGDSLTVDGKSICDSKEDGSTTVYMGLSPDPSGLVEGRADVESLTLLVTDRDTGESLGTVELEASNPPASYPDHARAVDTNALWYTADVSTYTQEENYDLRFWAVLTTAGGLELTAPNPAVTIRQDGGIYVGTYGDLNFSPA